MKHIYLEDEPILSGPKFVVLAARDKRSRVSGYEHRTDKEDGWIIVETDGFGNVEDIIAEDGGEIEDKNFARDLYHVVEAFEVMANQSQSAIECTSQQFQSDLDRSLGELKQARGAIGELEQKLEQTEAKLSAEQRLRKLAEWKLASDQCVDLAKVSDVDLGRVFLFEEYGEDSDAGETVRKWLLERAKVQP